MGETQFPESVLLILAAFSRHGEALDWAEQQAAEIWGPIALTSPRFPFVETQYYKTEMGTELQKQFFALENLIDPSSLATIKHQSNAWERAYAAATEHTEPRPLNLDPGYLTEAKLILATTKDRDHRIYVGQGMFAEITLFYRKGAWQPREWTYPNYRRADYHQFFDRCREYYRRRLRGG